MEIRRDTQHPSLTGINSTLGGRSANSYRAALTTAAPGEVVPAVVSDFNGTYVSEARIETPRTDPEFEMGGPAGGAWSEIDEQEEARVGDRLRFTYETSIPYFQDWQAEALRKIWSLRTDFEVTNVQAFPELRLITVEGIVRKPFSPVIYVAGALALAVVGVALYLSVSKIERLGELTIEKAGGWFGPVLAIGAAAFLLSAWNRARS